MKTKIPILITVLVLVIFLSGCVKQEESKQSLYEEPQKNFAPTSSSGFKQDSKQSPFEEPHEGAGKLQKYCGDGICDGPETCESCSQHCGQCLSEGQSDQTPEGEHPQSGDQLSEQPGLQLDEEAVCGDGICSPEETGESCPQDCTESPQAQCGNGVCENTEDQYNCPQDCCTEGQITTSGQIHCNEIWSGDIYITGDILADQDTVITILPGTNIWVAAHSDDNNLFGEYCNVEEQEFPENYHNPYKVGPQSTCEPDHISMRFYGELIAKGTPDNWINIHSGAEEPCSGDWLGLVLNDAHVEFEYVNASNYVATGLLTGDSSVRNSYFTMVKNCPVCLNVGASNVLIEHNHFEYTGGEMVDLHFEGAKIHYNIFGPAFPETNAIMVDSGEGADITHNIFKENLMLMYFDTSGPVTGNVQYNQFAEGSKIHFGCSTPAFKNNNVYSTVTDNGCVGYAPLDLSGNYWGTTDIDAIRARINNGTQIQGAREIIIEPILTAPVNIDEENIGIQW
jgi:hypothetical protein